MFFECSQISETAVFIQEGILVESTLLSSVADQTTLGDKLDINLHPLAGILHLLIRLGNVLGIRQLFCHLAAFPQESVQTGDRTGIAPQPQFHPEHHQTGVWIPAPHILDQFDFIGTMLVWVAVRTVGAVLQGCQRSVIPILPAIDILPVCVVADGCLGNAVLLRIAN